MDNSSTIRQEEKMVGRLDRKKKLKTTEKTKRLLREILEELNERMYQIQSLRLL